MGLTSAVLIDAGDAVWWQIAWPWKLYQAFYDVSAWAIAGVHLSEVYRRQTNPRSRSAAMILFTIQAAAAC